MLGPIFYREATVVPKRPKTYLMRGVYVLSLFLLLCTGYLVLDGSRSLATSSDAARFGGWMFTLLAPLQLLVLASLAAVGGGQQRGPGKGSEDADPAVADPVIGF